MSRRASFFAKLHPGRRRVRFPDEVVFEESIKESDGEAIIAMLRRVSLDIDVNRLNMAGMTALHQAVLDENIVVIRLLLIHGAEVNKRDADSWTPLHAAAANGHSNIVKYLLSQGADRLLLTDEGETAADLVDPDDGSTLALLLEPAELDEDCSWRRFSVQEGRVDGRKNSAAWFRRESLQEERKRSLIQEQRKGSAWVQRDILEEVEGEGDGEVGEEAEVNEKQFEEAVEGKEEDESLVLTDFINNDPIVEQFQVWRTRRKGRLELSHPDLQEIQKTGSQHIS
ncbi:protein phosphatase 1 regulatory subunit 12A [Eurytemora carolleeae]|uniref:protein phosphatase 1 regulatory subunit 12A n=1 Tax=Eurytemora carolleeae TaxID=1294199 RepID=UPI000C79317C|nr:protein phosphatase 1 regulatory subunit 12A [Eurytemora carolleeae]|eukprot:XP_023343078.1 protein phosphatase 1 regulatory subunit 12A-like [Eurytemora affinis]